MENLTRPKEKMNTPTEKYLISLRSEALKSAATRPRRIPIGKRPSTIRYDNGVRIELTADPFRPYKARFDNVTIVTPTGTYDLKQMVNPPVVFWDVSDDFEFRGSSDLSDPVRYMVLFGSKLLRVSQKNIYTLLHELSHVTVTEHGHPGNKASLERTVWEEADELVKTMGLVLFENDTERQLFRDISLRTYDPYAEAGVVRDGLMKRITCRRFSFDTTYGLTEAANRGLPLEPLCKKLLEEKKSARKKSKVFSAG